MQGLNSTLTLMSHAGSLLFTACIYIYEYMVIMSSWQDHRPFVALLLACRSCETIVSCWDQPIWNTFSIGAAPSKALYLISFLRGLSNVNNAVEINSSWDGFPAFLNDSQTSAKDIAEK